MIKALNQLCRVAAVAGSLAFVAAASAQSTGSGRSAGSDQSAPASRVLVELAWARPLGDVGADYPATRLGLGAADGLEAGFRWRYHLTGHLSVSPAFHFLDYRNFTSTAPVIGDFRVAASSLRYTVEAMYLAGDEARSVRPFAAVGAGLFRNRVDGFHKTEPAAFDESVNTLGVTLRAGVRLGSIELSAIYGMNRFTTWQYFRSAAEDSYDWDNFALRGGWVLPFRDGPPAAKSR